MPLWKCAIRVTEFALQAEWPILLNKISVYASVLPSYIIVLVLYNYKKRTSEKLKFFWCDGRDLNPYPLGHAPQTCAYANSATIASRFRNVVNYSACVIVCQQ